MRSPVLLWICSFPSHVSLAILYSSAPFVFSVVFLCREREKEIAMLGTTLSLRVVALSENKRHLHRVIERERKRERERRFSPSCLSLSLNIPYSLPAMALLHTCTSKSSTVEQLAGVSTRGDWDRLTCRFLGYMNWNAVLPTPGNTDAGGLFFCSH
jgi:hypothetical protein